MEEEILLRFALATSIIGIAALLFTMSISEDSESSLSGAKMMDEGSGILIKAEVESIRQGENMTIITLSKKESVSVVAFGNISLRKGDLVEVKGEIKEYKGKKEVVADKVTLTK